MATLGINPSSLEFLNRRGGLLTGENRRLVTAQYLGVSSDDPFGDAAAQAVVNDCASYFGRNPYRRWFGALDRVLQSGLGVSYWSGTASHLDLVQWATAPVWRWLDEAARRRLLEADLPFLERQLATGGWRVVVVNGRTVMNWVERAGLVAWTEEAHLPGPPRTHVSVGYAGGALFVGWSCNLQSQPGARALSQDLASLLADIAGDRLALKDLGTSP